MKKHSYLLASSNIEKTPPAKSCVQRWEGGNGVGCAWVLYGHTTLKERAGELALLAKGDKGILGGHTWCAYTSSCSHVEPQTLQLWLGWLYSCPSARWLVVMTWHSI